jgi:hypothetical protein
MRPSRAARLRCCFPCDWALRRRLSRTDHALSPRPGCECQRGRVDHARNGRGRGVRTARSQTPARVSGCRSARRAAAALAARPSRACTGPAPWKRCHLPRPDRARSHTSPTSSAPGHARFTGGTFTAHRGRVHHGSTSAGTRDGTRPPDALRNRSFCRDFFPSCPHLCAPFIRRCTTHNREVPGSNPGGATRRRAESRLVGGARRRGW